MGYDIYAVTQPGTDAEVKEKRDERRRLMNEARAEGVGSLYESDHPLAVAALNAGAEADALEGYFRLNVWGMGTARGELCAAGVVVDFDHSPFPQHDCIDIRDDQDCPECREWSNQVIDGPGIPLFKLCSNDGWLINPIEIQSGIHLADSSDPSWRDELTDYVRAFVDYLEAVAGGGGCVVS